MSKSSLYRFKQRAEHFHLSTERASANASEEGKEEILFTTNILPPELASVDDKIIQPERTYKVVQPNEKEQVILSIYQSELAGGFRGVLSLYRKISLQYLGITRADISKVLSKVETKQLKRPTLARTIIPITEQKAPMDMLQIDLMNFEHLKKFNSGYSYLLNIIDIFSKFLWSIPLKNKSGEVVAYHIQNLIMTEGTPRIILSDNGGEFVNEHIDELSERFGFEMRHGHPYSKGGQGVVEEVNGTMRDSIHAYMNENKTKQYIDKLPMLVYSYNTSQHSTTKYSPFLIHRKKNEIFNLDNVVRKNIIKASEKMIKRLEKANQKEQEPLEVGDHVRISTSSLIAVKKKGEITINAEKHRGEIAGWSKEIAKVIQVLEREDGVIQYKLSHEGKRKLFQRSELQKVDKKNLIESGQKTKEDLSFGQHFDLEQHLSEIRNKESNITQDELEKRHEDDVVVSKGSSLARPKREKKKTDMFAPSERRIHPSLKKKLNMIK